MKWQKIFGRRIKVCRKFYNKYFEKDTYKHKINARQLLLLYKLLVVKRTLYFKPKKNVT